MKLLQIDSSILGTQSASRELTAAIVARWRAAHPGIEIRYLDLAAEPLPHLSAISLAKGDVTEAARAERALQEFLAADVVVIGAPMYNFSIPSTLKAWIDRIAVAGRTFRYTAEGPVGLAGGKQVIVATSRGGAYSGTADGDFVEAYLRFQFRFLGIEDVSFVRAEGLAISAERREQGIAAAQAALAALPSLATAA
jgi:FMN-dependent NADH-azoreductase